MQIATRKRTRLAAAAGVVVAALALTACSGGSSDSADGASNGSRTLSLFGYAVPKPGFDAVTKAFAATDAGKDITFQTSYGASGDQSRKVKDGAPADVVSFSVEPDVTRLVDAGLVAEDWNQDAYHGVPFGSVVTIVAREGNPKGIHDWDDLLAPGISVVTPNPFSSGSAKWNLLAPYAAKSNGGQDRQAGLDYIQRLVGEHVKVQPTSGREATETFLQGTGDVLLSYENEALFAERNGEKVEHITPASTFRIDNPFAVLTNAKNPVAAAAFRDYLYTEPAQRLWAQNGFRPVDPSVRAEFAADFPTPAQLWTINDLGGWKKVDQDLFAQGSGAIAQIYDRATR